MIFKRAVARLRGQDWLAITIELAIVIIGAFAAIFSRTLGDGAAAERYALQVLQVVPRDSFSLSVLRDQDTARGNLQMAKARYESLFPELASSSVPKIHAANFQAAIDFAYVLKKAGEIKHALALLAASEVFIQSIPRLTWNGFWLSDARIYALRGNRAKALLALRSAQQEGWRGPLWRYYRDADPILAPLRDQPEFKAIFADIERDMARQRAALAARPKDAPLDLQISGT